MENNKLQNQLSHEEYTVYKQAFELFDSNSDGYIDKQELLQVFHNLGQFPSDSQLDEMMVKADTHNRDGQIELEEFVDFMKTYSTKDRSKNEEMESLFRVFDRDGNGLIDREELRITMHNLGEKLSEKELDMMIRAADSDGDGLITFDDFSKMFFSQSS